MIQRLRPEDADLASAPLLLQCLGAFRLRDSIGNELTPRGRKARALLAVLALSGRPCPRNRLADLLWSDRGEEQAKSSLRQALFELRHFDAAGALKASGRNEIELNGDRITTDLELVSSAAEQDDAQQLAELLRAANAGLLADLDGLDPEFDAWLRMERAHQPARTLTRALDSAERLFVSVGAQAAQSIVTEVRRLDPCCEAAARLSMRVDHATGDMAALHRHFALLRERLREDCGAEPSRETLDLFAELGSVAAMRSKDRTSDHVLAADGPNPSDKPRFGRLALAGPALAALALAGAAAWNMRAPPAAVDEPPLIAVLPFQQQETSNDFLAQGLWDDTRAALSQHGAVRVLGRVTTEALATSKAQPREYRDKLGVSYILDGRVRQQGDRVRVAVSLTRTSDGISIWDSTFQGRLGDPLALQEAVAQGIEGRLRGRLAPGGGKRPEQIATSSEVYGLYTKARALLHERDLSQSRTAEQLLRRAVALDPNYAPAWASLATAMYLGKSGPEQSAARQAEARSHARRALALAPNLAQAHSTQAFLEGVGSPTAERALRRSIELDPGNAEAWNWLANTRATQYRYRDAMAGYERALAIDPLLRPAAQNMADMAGLLHDDAAMSRLTAMLARAGADREFILSLQGQTALERGDYSAALGPLLALRASLPGQEYSTASSYVGELLIRLGYQDEAARIWNGPDWLAATLRSEQIPPDKMKAEDYWTTFHFPVFNSRAMLNLGHGRELVEKYHAAFKSRDAFIVAMDANGILVPLAPNLAAALNQLGDRREAGFILGAAESRIRERMKNAPLHQELLWEMARIRGAQGKREQAALLVEAAVTKGFLPDGNWYALDIAQEPSLRGLKGDRQFEASRKKILDHIARERRELGPINF